MYQIETEEAALRIIYSLLYCQVSLAVLIAAAHIAPQNGDQRAFKRQSSYSMYTVNFLFYRGIQVAAAEAFNFDRITENNFCYGNPTMVVIFGDSRKSCFAAVAFVPLDMQNLASQRVQQPFSSLLSFQYYLEQFSFLLFASFLYTNVQEIWTCLAYF